MRVVVGLVDGKWFKELSAVETVEVEGVEGGTGGEGTIEGRRISSDGEVGHAVDGVVACEVWVWEDDRRTRVENWSVDVAAWVLLLPLGAPVLEPDLHLRLGEVEAQGKVESLAHRQVPRLSELVLQ